MRNGTSKSTTMRVVAGLDRPTSGTVRVNGKHYPDAAAPMSELGILLDARSVHPGLSARNNLLALARTAGDRVPRWPSCRPGCPCSGRS